MFVFKDFHSLVSRKAVEKEKLKTDAELSLRMKDNCNETTVAFFLQTYLEVRRKQMKKQKEEVSDSNISKHGYRVLLKQLTPIAKSQQTFTGTSISLFSP